MKLKTLSLTIIAIFAALALLVSASQAQDKPKDTVILTVGFLNAEYKALFDLGAENEQGITAAFNARIAGDKTRLGGKFRFDQVNGSRRYLFGPELARKIGFVEPYAHALFGFEDGYEADTGRRFVRTYGGGVRLNFGHVVLQPFQYDATLADGLGQRPVSQVSASVGVRF